MVHLLDSKYNYLQKVSYINCFKESPLAFIDIQLETFENNIYKKQLLIRTSIRTERYVCISKRQSLDNNVMNFYFWREKMSIEIKSCPLNFKELYFIKKCIALKWFVPE